MTKHQVPEWIIDAKFGIYAHWGVYSVPAFGSEWYARRMYDKNDNTFEFHQKKYGRPSKFGYKDLVLLSMGKWPETNGEAIYGTRPWKIHAEGPQERLNIGRGRRSKWVFDDCDARDIRFTRKGNALYAIALGWPETGQLTVKTLGDNTRVATGGIKKVSLLGSKRKLKWSRSDAGLSVKLPNLKQDEYAYTLKIEVGSDLVLD